ncbi:hypothetical protein GCM10028811_35420 [Uliginosibacterium sediminicola]
MAQLHALGFIEVARQAIGFEQAAHEAAAGFGAHLFAQVAGDEQHFRSARRDAHGAAGGAAFVAVKRRFAAALLIDFQIEIGKSLIEQAGQQIAGFRGKRGGKSRMAGFEKDQRLRAIHARLLFRLFAPPQTALCGASCGASKAMASASLNS